MPGSDAPMVAAFDIRVDGRSLTPSQAGDVTRLVYRDDLAQLDGFLIELNNWAPETLETVYSDAVDFLPGRRVDVALGYAGAEGLTPMVSGAITASRAVFSTGDAQTLTVVGRGRLGGYLGPPVTQTYRQATDGDIARQIAERLGVPIQTASGGGPELLQDYVLQLDTPDVVFLRGRASRLGYVLEATEDGGEPGLYFGPPRSGASVYKVLLGDDLGRFTALLDAGSQPSKVTVRSWDQVQKQPIVATADRTSLLAGSLADLDRRISVYAPPAEETVVDHGAPDQGSADALAAGLMADALAGFMTGEGEGVGAPALRAGARIDVDGVGAAYSGLWMLTSTTHTLDERGYRTSFGCRRVADA